MASFAVRAPIGIVSDDTGRGTKIVLQEDDHDVELTHVTRVEFTIDARDLNRATLHVIAPAGEVQAELERIILNGRGRSLRFRLWQWWWRLRR